MRIIAGEWRGRKLDAPAGLATRPTTDRVRETLFSMLVSRVGSFDGLRIADLFAGSGALGFEALSRGAASATFVDQDPAALDAIRANAARLGVTDRVRVTPGSALALPKAEPFDLIFSDPPYAPGSGSGSVSAIASAGWLTPGGWLSVETARGDDVDTGPFDLVVIRNVGRARITLLRRP